MTQHSPALALALALLASLSAYAVVGSVDSASAQSAETEKIVETMRMLSGNPKARPSGAKGQCVVGQFTPTGEAKSLSKSVAFQRPSRVVARFSVGGGNPKVADGARGPNRGFSLRIDDGGPGQTEFVMINAPINFVNTPEQMLAFLQARVPGADGKPDAAKIKAFTDANPETTLQAKYLAGKPIPASWVATNYWAVHPYTLTSATGAKQVVKFQLAPLGGEAGLTDDEAKTKPTEFLVDDLKARIASGRPAGFEMLAIIGKPGEDKTKATEQWADEDARPRVKIGTLTITAVQDNATCDNTIFDPQLLAEGVEGPKDPLFEARRPAYAISIGQRL